MKRYTAEKGSYERTQVLGAAYSSVYGHNPDYSRLDGLRTKFGVESLAATIYQFDGKDFVGDPMDYITRTLQKKQDEGTTGSERRGPRRLSWHYSGYRNNVPEDDLTIPEISARHGDGGLPQAIIKRRGVLGKFSRYYECFEHRARLAYAMIANPGWVNSPQGQKAVKQYHHWRASYVGEHEQRDREWPAYCEKYVPEEYRHIVKEMDLP